MYDFRGLGVACPAGQVDLGAGVCVDDLLALQAATDANTQLYTGVPVGPNASNSISVTIPSGLTLNAQGQVVSGQTFTQWVEANSTILLVAFGAIGALVAFTRIGK